MRSRKPVAFTRTIRTACGPWLEAANFSEQQPSRNFRNFVQVWSRPQKSDFLALWFQRSVKSLDVALLGAEFTVELFLSTDPAGISWKKRCRLYPLLTSDELATMVSRHNAILEQLPSEKEMLDLDEIQTLTVPDHASFLRRPFNPNQERWFRYFSATDIHDWARFLAAVLPGAIERFNQRNGATWP